jgi:hypothetical protein
MRGACLHKKQHIFSPPSYTSFLLILTHCVLRQGCNTLAPKSCRAAAECSFNSTDKTCYLPDPCSGLTRRKCKKVSDHCAYVKSEGQCVQHFGDACIGLSSRLCRKDATCQVIKREALDGSMIKSCLSNVVESSTARSTPTEPVRTTTAPWPDDTCVFTRFTGTSLFMRAYPDPCECVLLLLSVVISFSTSFPHSPFRYHAHARTHARTLLPNTPYFPQAKPL